MTRTAVNITGDAVCTTIVAKQDNAVNVEIFNREGSPCRIALCMCGREGMCEPDRSENAE